MSSDHQSPAPGFQLPAFRRWRSIVWRVLVALTIYASAAGGQQDVVRHWVGAHQREVLQELSEVVSIPNVASDRRNIRRNADYLRQMLERRGLSAELLETSGNPLVFGELKVPGASRTLLLYAHYDGQPVDPSAWKQSSPFAPVLRSARIDQGGGLIPDLTATAIDPEWRLYARSAADDKAPIVALCAALDALRSAGLQPSSNIRVILDGEEEANSVSLVPAIAKYRDRLRADLMVILDGPIHSSGRPTVVYGARGIATADLTVFGPKVGVHSGNYGNWIPNPAQRLSALLASMVNDEGRVLVGGFYDGIASPTPEERGMLDAVPDDSDRMLRTFGVARPQPAFAKLQDALQAPTLNVRGLVSAHVGSGARTIIPDRATAALDLRLVKETRASDLLKKIRAHIRRQGYFLVDREPDDRTRAQYSKIARLAVSKTATNAFRTAPADPQARTIAASIEKAFGAPPIQLRTLGGTVPIAPFIDALGFPAVIVPTVNFDSNQHEENENLRLGSLFQAIEIIAAVMRS